MCVCVCLWSVAWQPKFQRPISLSSSGLGDCKVATQQTTNYLSDLGKVAFDHASHATFPRSDNVLLCACVCVCVCVCACIHACMYVHNASNEQC